MQDSDDKAVPFAGARSAPEQPARVEPAKKRPSAIVEITESTEPGPSPKAFGVALEAVFVLGSSEELHLYAAVRGEKAPCPRPKARGKGVVRNWCPPKVV